MKATFKVNDSIQFEQEVSNHKEALEFIASMTEVFGVSQCGACKNTNIRFVVREVAQGKKEFKFYEVHCQNPKCRARLAYGQHSTGDTLFPKRKDDGGNYIPNNGWSKWEGNKE